MYNQQFLFTLTTVLYSKVKHLLVLYWSKYTLTINLLCELRRIALSNEQYFHPPRSKLNDRRSERAASNWRSPLHKRGKYSLSADIPITTRFLLTKSCLHQMLSLWIQTTSRQLPFYIDKFSSRWSLYRPLRKRQISKNAKMTAVNCKFG